MTTTPASARPSSSLALPVLDEALADRLVQRLALVEAGLDEAVQSQAPFVTEAAQHLLQAGGKRFRPLLVLLAAEAAPEGSGDLDQVVTSACVVELTHLASLYHDDVMDEADLRRGTPSANARWDNLVAILTGDWLFSKSSELTARLGADAVRIQAETFSRLVEGQILETLGPDNGDPLEHYLRVVEGKTGSLIATSARYGAIFGGCPPEVQRALTAYGEKVGVAFQLSDDILDIASESGESGKTPGTDLREGVPTLPVLMAQRSANPADARLLELLAADLADDDALHAEALALLRVHPAMDQARAYVLDLAREAADLLTTLPEGPVRDALTAFADLIATRTA
ncbi:MAG: polyprenyl synthetase family protein [Nocardioidaceae bacterium]